MSGPRSVLRIAVLTPRSHPWHGYGGLERHVFDLCRHLLREGIEVDLFTSAPETPANPFDGNRRFRSEVIPGKPFLKQRFAVVLSRSILYPLFSLRMGRRIAEQAREREYSAVIAQGLTGFGFSIWARKLGIDCPLILNPQGMEESITPNPLKHAAYTPFRVLMQRTAKRAARVVATDDVLVDAVREVLGVPRERILVIPNAVDVADCVALVNGDDRRHVLERVEAADAKPLLVTVGRLAPNKGFDVALRALARIGEQLPGTWKWIIVGDGPLGDQLGARIRALGVSDHVRLAGALSDAETHNLLAAADVFLNPTLYEGSSLVTLEAMAHGRAIVATRAGGIPDKITEGETGWLVAPGDPAAFGEAILRCWTAGPAERAKRGDAARARCLERFDWSVATRRYVEAIRELSRSGTGLTA